MSSVSLSPELVQRIDHARELPHHPRTQRFVQPSTIAQTLADRAALHPDAPFLTYLPEQGIERRYSYGDFYDQVRALAALFKIHGGIGHGDRIATAMHNHDLAILTYFAAWHLGAVAVPLNMGEEDRRLAYILQHSKAKAVIVLPEYAERMRPLWKEAKIDHFFYAGPQAGAKVWEYSVEEHLKTSDAPWPVIDPQLQPDDEALIVYTSGTTGVPKGVLLSQYNLAVDGHAIARWHGFNAASRLICVLPVHHVNGLVVTHITPLVCGASVLLTRKFSASQFFEQIRRHAIDVVSVVPTLLQFLLEAHASGTDVGTLKYVICGAGPLSTELAARFEDRFVPVIHGYGLSETTCYSCFLPLVNGRHAEGAQSLQSADEHRIWMRAHGYPSIGVPISTNLMAIHDEQGNSLSEGQKGEIVARGHNIMLGYYDNPTANQNAFTHGWFRSGDEGFFKRGPDGLDYFFICGRFKELIIRGGVKISPLEVDEVISTVAGVKAGMAVGFENTTYGEEVGAYVVKAPDSNVTADEILAACRAKLPAWMSPKVVVFGETFPVTSTGKYQRNQLKPLFAEYKDRQFK